MAGRDPCPVGCGRTRREGHFMCGRCWRILPVAERRRYLRVWRDYEAGEISLGDLLAHQREFVELVRAAA